MSQEQDVQGFEVRAGGLRVASVLPHISCTARVLKRAGMADAEVLPYYVPYNTTYKRLGLSAALQGPVSPLWQALC
jgi:hypothetical protein